VTSSWSFIRQPLTLSVEKTVNVHVFKQVYKPRNINVLFSQCVDNGMAVHLTRCECEEF